MRGNNSPSVTWVNKRRGGKEPRAGILSLLGCLEMGSERVVFRCTTRKSAENTTIADGI